MHIEWKRQVLHILLLLGAFSLRWLERWQAVVLLGILLGAVLWLAPKFSRRHELLRSHESWYGNGGVWYALTLLALAVVFPLYIVAASWAVLALGDGAATLLGQSIRGRRVPWNREKTVAGTVGFIFCGALGCAWLLNWMNPDFGWLVGLTIGVRVALVAAVIESLPLPIDDNITVPLVSAAVLSSILGG